MVRRLLTEIEAEEEELHLSPADSLRIRLVPVVAHLFERARLNLVHFFNMVAKEETTRERIKVLPHQRLFLDFIQAHPRCVIFQPPGTAKTFNTGIVTLFLLGSDPTERGAILSATQGQAAKVLAMVRDYIESSTELRGVFPGLRPSTREGDPWTQTAITVDRPRGIRDASLTAVGIGGALPGSRLSWLVVDDILDRENTATHEQRQKVIDFFDVTAMSRMDPTTSRKGKKKEGRVVVTNTAHHEHDLQHHLVRKGWPAIRMSLEGNIFIYNTDWDVPYIRPVTNGPRLPEGPYRLTEHDRRAPGKLDVNNEIGLWPAKFPPEEITTLKHNHSAKRYAQLYEQKCRDEESQRCKDSWVEVCKLKGRGLKQMHQYRGPNLVCTGVDLAFKEGEEYDYVAFVTVEFMPDGMRRLLEVEYGQWDGPTVVDKLLEKAEKFGGVLRVENNSCFAEGTNVLTRTRGYVPIETVVEGDEVWTHLGRWQRVTGLVEGNARLSCTAKAIGNLPIITTPNHWFWMREAGRSPGRMGGHSIPVGDAVWVSNGFREKEGYAAIAIPRWEQRSPTITIGTREVVVDVELGLVLGLWLAEGHTTDRQVYFTFNRKEQELVDYLNWRLPRICRGQITERLEPTVRRLCLSNTELARAFKPMGKSSHKAPPMNWWGWPLEVRLGIVRGWLLGDGCLRLNNAGTQWPKLFFSGVTISRNLAAFMRFTLLEAGYRPTITRANRRQSIIEGRVVNTSPIYKVALNHEDSAKLRATMTLEVERVRWQSVTLPNRRSNSSMLIEDGVGWAKLVSPSPGGPFERSNPRVFNLLVEGDESYTVEDYLVHNAQDYILQFARKKKKSVRVRAHTTGRNKAHPEFGVEGLFVEVRNEAWVFPCDEHGNPDPEVQWLLEGMTTYDPAKHTHDGLMALWFAVEQGRELGAFKVLQGSGSGASAGVGR